MSFPRYIVPKWQPDIDALKALILETAPERYRKIIERTMVRVTDTRRGRADMVNFNVTVPAWAMARGTDYTHWYLAHELAHVLAWQIAHVRGHGEVFQNIMQNLTPYAHHELNYKPKLAAAAGIRKPQEDAS